ncbi:MAG: hypothetical protein J5851_01285, partial [Oscillospiraceae bacterium]|nr:hypothetical protein [Oscillospiraceae bacterium]
GSVYFFITDTPFDAWNIVLGYDLKLNFYTDESSVTDATCGEFSVRYTGESVDKSSPVTKTDDGNWEASAHIYAKNINQPITAQLYKGDVPVGAPITKSARDYLRSLETAYTTQYTQAVAAQQAQNAAAIKKRLAMVMATELFGDASDAYFQSTGNVNDAEVTTAITQYMAMANKTDNDITTALTGYNLPDNDVKISLVLDSKTALRVYTKYDPNISGQFVRDSVGTDVTSSSGGIAPAEYHSYFELTGLTPLHLGDMYKLSLGDGNINYTPVSALTWSQRVLNSTDQQSTRNINMAKALYAYYAAANEYSTLGQS